MAPRTDKKIIEVDASHWMSGADLYNATFAKLGAPDWHGTSVNALSESIVWGEINSVEPPFTLRIRSTSGLPSDLLQELNWLKEVVADAREESQARYQKDVDVDVDVELIP